MDNYWLIRKKFYNIAKEAYDSLSELIETYDFKPKTGRTYIVDQQHIDFMISYASFYFKNHVDDVNAVKQIMIEPLLRGITRNFADKVLKSLNFDLDFREENSIIDKMTIDPKSLYDGIVVVKQKMAHIALIEYAICQKKKSKSSIWQGPIMLS